MRIIGSAWLSLSALAVVGPLAVLPGRRRASAHKTNATPGELDVSVPAVAPVHCPFATQNPCPNDCRICVAYRLYPGSPGRMIA